MPTLKQTGTCVWKLRRGDRLGEPCGVKTRLITDGKYMCHKHGSALVLKRMQKQATIEEPEDSMPLDSDEERSEDEESTEGDFDFIEELAKGNVDWAGNQLQALADQGFNLFEEEEAANTPIEEEEEEEEEIPEHQTRYTGKRSKAGNVDLEDIFAPAPPPAKKQKTSTIQVEEINDDPTNPAVLQLQRQPTVQEALYMKKNAKKKKNRHHVEMAKMGYSRMLTAALTKFEFIKPESSGAVANALYNDEGIHECLEEIAEDYDEYLPDTESNPLLSLAFSTALVVAAASDPSLFGMGGKPVQPSIQQVEEDEDIEEGDETQEDDEEEDEEANDY